MQNIKTFYDQNSFEAKQVYHRAAGHFLNHYNFTSEKDKIVWELHTEGVSIRNIVIALQIKGFKAYKDQVHLILQRLAKEMYAGKT